MLDVPQPVGGLGELEALAWMVGFFMPLLVAIFERPTFGRWRPVVSVVLCVLASLVTVHVQHGLHIDGHLFGVSAQVVAGAQVMYLAFWKPTGIATKWEAVTTPGTHTHTAAMAAIAAALAIVLLL